MDLIKCPVCGEKYSSSYRRCPFCEEEDRPRKVSGKRRGGHHVAERKHTHSARGPLIAVLLVVLVVFSWYLFGGKFMEKIQEDRANDVENVDPAPVDPTPVDPTPVDPTPDEPTPPLVEKRAYRDDVNPFLTPEGRNARFDRDAAPRTLDILARTMYVGVGWNQPFEEIEKYMKEL